MMANHEYGIAATDACAINEATIRARDEVHRLVDGLRSLGGAWENVRIVATPGITLLTLGIFLALVGYGASDVDWESGS